MENDGLGWSCADVQVPEGFCLGVEILAALETWFDTK